MRLNRQVHGLPHWPHIIQTGEGEVTVEGRHISYGRFIVFLWVFRLGSLAGFYFLVKYLYVDPRHYTEATMYLLGYFLAYLLLLGIFPVQRWLCWLLFRKRTRVVFSAEKILAGRRWRHLNVPVTVQFRASQQLNDGNEVRFSRFAHYFSRFRLVEMIYGMEVIPIASIDNEHSAAQFALALQYAYGLVHGSSRDASKAAMAYDDLPE